jgi:hypothetical protein
MGENRMTRIAIIDRAAHPTSRISLRSIRATCLRLAGAGIHAFRSALDEKPAAAVEFYRTVKKNAQAGVPIELVCARPGFYDWLSYAEDHPR